MLEETLDSPGNIGDRYLYINKARYISGITVYSILLCALGKWLIVDSDDSAKRTDGFFTFVQQMFCCSWIHRSIISAAFIYYARTSGEPVDNTTLSTMMMAFMGALASAALLFGRIFFVPEFAFEMLSRTSSVASAMSTLLATTFSRLSTLRTRATSVPEL